MPKMKTKKGAAKRFRVRAGGSDQARTGVQAPHPHQEDHQEQAPSARHRARSHEANVRLRASRCCRTRKGEPTCLE